MHILTPQMHGMSVTVPGAAAAWEDTLSHFGSGKISLAEALKPAIDIAGEKARRRKRYYMYMLSL